MSATDAPGTPQGYVPNWDVDPQQGGFPFKLRLSQPYIGLPQKHTPTKCPHVWSLELDS